MPHSRLFLAGGTFFFIILSVCGKPGKVFLSPHLVDFIFSVEPNLGVLRLLPDYIPHLIELPGLRFMVLHSHQVTHS